MDYIQPANSAAVRRRVVVVDDDPSLLLLMERWLTSAGYEVEVYNEFKSARARLVAQTPDVLITDVRLGAFNGLHLVVIAKQARPEMTAIVLTGFEDHVLQHDAISAGAEFLLKPVSAERLLLAVAPVAHGV